MRKMAISFELAVPQVKEVSAWHRFLLIHGEFWRARLFLRLLLGCLLGLFRPCRCSRGFTLLLLVFSRGGRGAPLSLLSLKVRESSCPAGPGFPRSLRLPRKLGSLNQRPGYLGSVRILLLFQEPGADSIPEVGEASPLAIEAGALVLPNLVLEDPGPLDLEKEPMAQFEIVGSRVEWEGLPCVVNAVVK